MRPTPAPVRPSRLPRALAVGLAGAATAAALGACSGALGGREATRDAAPPPVGQTLFTALPSSYTGVRFANRLTDSPALNVFTFRNFYNGGGVAVGDLTGDGLPELVVTANQGGARLYVNEGRFRFRDVTEASGMAGGREKPWTTGVTMADVNGDGRLDVYVCHSGLEGGAARANALWINEGLGPDGAPRFTEQAARLGVADGGYSTHAAFLDYDRDGDLDLFLVRNSPRPVTSFGARNTRHVRDSLGGARLYRNDGGRFADVSARAGVFGPENAFGLGVVAADLDGDGWTDLYEAHDYYERDYLYLNNRDGTFREVMDRASSVGSFFSMGLDAADLDNDGRADLYTTDMFPEDERRLKATTAFEGWDVYQAKVRTGYGHQLMRNMLQHNQGDGTFAERGQLAGVARTDWSWSALIADLDLDGLKDIFVTTGVAKDVTSQDYVAFLANQETMKSVTQGGRVDFMRLVGALTSTPVPNYAFRNRGGLTFTNEAQAWGLDAPSLSNGAAYGDLDGDGAPDLVVNNVDGEAFVYRNNARVLRPGHHFLQLRLEGGGANRFGVGATATVWADTARLVQELSPARGFQSSVDYTLTFGLGARAAADSVVVRWPDGRASVLRQVAGDRRLTVRYADAAPAPRPLAPPAPALLAAGADSAALAFVHRENPFVDFDRERLLPKMLSTEGPALAVADVNGDGLDDVYLGGAKDQAGALFVQRASGAFERGDSAVFAATAIAEDVGAVFLDANRDGRPDLYVVSGGNEFSAGAPALQDRLYLNDGRGHFRQAVGALPSETESGSRPAAADFDGDGAVDVFVGGRSVPWHYGRTPRSTLLRNDGRGHFVDVTDRAAPGLSSVGMVTDAAWADVDGDRRPDLVVVGEWMPVTVFRNAGGGRFVKLAPAGLVGSEGWWNRVVPADVDGDGRMDFVVGNLGLNGRLQASATAPVQMHVHDWLGGGYDAQILSTVSAGRRYPLAGRDELLRAIPYLKARYLKYDSYAGQTLADVFPGDSLRDAVLREARTFATAVVHNEGAGRFTVRPLPVDAQLAPVYGIVARDFDGDGSLDLLLGGNFDGFQPEIGRMHASRGLLLRGDGRGAFLPVAVRDRGVVIEGQVRDIARVRTAAGDRYVVARNNDRPLVLRAAPNGMPSVARAATHARARTLALTSRPTERDP